MPLGLSARGRRYASAATGSATGAGASASAAAGPPPLPNHAVALGRRGRLVAAGRRRRVVVREHERGGQLRVATVVQVDEELLLEDVDRAVDLRLRLGRLRLGEGELVGPTEP